MMSKHHLCLQSILFQLVVIFCLPIMIDSFAEEWQVISEIPTPRHSFSVAAVDGKIYLIGGTLFKNQNGPFGLSLVEMYDPGTNSWQRVADMPTPRAGVRTAVVDGKIYVIGGYSGIDNRGENFNTLKVVEVYDPQTDIWEKQQDMSLPRSQFGIGVIAGKIYAIGGFVHPGGNKPGAPWRIDLVEAYDPVTDTWAKRANMPTRRSSVEGAVVNGLIYAIGGTGWPQLVHGGPNLTTIEEYNSKINRWRRKKEMPNLRTSFAIIVLENNIYLMGGFVRIAGIVKFLDTIEIYNPETEEWREGTPLPTARMPGGTVRVDGNIYMFGWTEQHGNKWVRSPLVEVFGTGFHAVTASGKLPVRWGALKTQRQN